MAAKDMELRFRFQATDPHTTISMLESVLEGLVRYDSVWFSQHRDAPCCLTHAQVQYVDPMLCKGEFCQTLLGAPTLLESRVGTCADMATYVAGWIRANLGRPAVVKVEQQFDHYGRPMPDAYHAYVISDGMRFDPSEEVKAGICRCPQGAW